MSDDEANPVLKIAAARTTYVITFAGKQYHVPKHAVDTLPLRPCVVPDSAALGSILSSKSPEKWLPACDPGCLMVLKGREGSSVYATFAVEGHPEEQRFARLIAGHIAEKNFPKVLLEQPDPQNEAEKARLEVLNWQPEDCKVPQLSPLTNQWEINLDPLVSCRVDPERRARNFKNGGKKRPIGACDDDGEPIDKMPEQIKFIKHYAKTDDTTYEVIQHGGGAVTVLAFSASPADPVSEAEV